MGCLIMYSPVSGIVNGGDDYDRDEEEPPLSTFRPTEREVERRLYGHRYPELEIAVNEVPNIDP